MDAKMLIGLGLNGLVPNMPLVSVDDTSINIYGAVTNTFKDPLTPSNTINDAINKAIRDEVNTRLNAGTLAVLMGSQVKSLVEGFVADFNKPIEQNVDLKGLGLEQKSAELELTKLQMDTSGEFVQLSAKIKAIATPADPITSVFRLNVTDSCLSGGVAVVPAPMGCPGYVAP
jgi:hypothetical protein